MSRPNHGGWIELINRSSSQGLHKDVLRLFHQFLRSGDGGFFRPHPYVLPGVLRACAHLSLLNAGRGVHGVVVRSSFDSDAFVGSALIDMYCKCRRVRSARLVFDGTLERDLVVWNSMVAGYAQRGLPEPAMVLSVKMRAFGVQPDAVTWNALISGFSRAGDFGMAMDSLIQMQAERIEPDVVSWTSVIHGLVLNFKYGRAFEVFKQMTRVAGVMPSYVTVSSLLSACANVADLRRGKELHGHALALGLGKDLHASSALVDMYAKGGLISDACRVFQSMRERNTVAWNSMIFGYANHGYCDEAIELFYQMEKEAMAPDHLTFTALLSACSHGGKVELGRKLFRAMQGEYGIVPRLENYACMVDLLGRAGNLGEAYDLIRAMPMKPDSFVWGALLGSSRHQGNLELAELAASHLRDLEPWSAGSTVILSNMLAGVGRQRDAGKMKKLSKRRKMRTLLACSWMQTL